MLNWDEIKAEIERLYDKVQLKIKETEGTDEEQLGRGVAKHLWKAIDHLDTELHFMRRRSQ